VRITYLELSRLPEFGGSAPLAGARAGEYLARHLLLRAGGRDCAVSEPARPLAAASGWSVTEWRLACPAADALEIESRVLRAVAPSHLHFARVRGADGTIRERVLSFRDPDWELSTDADAGAPAGTSLSGYVRIGIEHILSGADHLAFLFALILLAASLGEVTMLVTGFTVAHSVTLGAAALGVLRPDVGAVEALIGFSVALVAIENAWLLAGRGGWVPAVLVAMLGMLALLAARGVGSLSALTLMGLALFSFCHFALLQRVERPARLRAAIAFAFGLVHGFGFAGVLAELALPRGRLVPALFGFNAGVEIGQLAVVALIWPTLRLVSRLREGHAELRVAEVGSAAVCGLGVFWFVSRAFS
jgi:hypothetical protein